MAITLSDIKIGRADKYDRMVIDTFIRKSAILAAMPFDNCISPSGGSTLTYGYIRLKTSPAAEGRAINSDYTAAPATKEAVTTDLQIMGGKYEIDRVLADAAPDEIAFQTEEKIQATVNRYHWLLVNGDKNNQTEFDGLAKIVDGSVTDFDGSGIDLSTMNNTATALKITEALDTAILAMKERPTYILANSKAIVKIQSAAKQLGYITQAEDAFGKPVRAYDGIPMIDLGRYYNEDLGSDTEIIGIDDASGKTDIYLVALSMSGAHGITLKGDKAITSRLPNFSEAGAVKSGDVEFVAGLAVKNTRGIARIKDVQVQATLTALGTLTVAAAVNKVTVTPKKPKIGNEYYYAVDASVTISAPTANTALSTDTWTPLPANGVISLAENGYVRVVEADSSSLLPVATGVDGPVVTV
ncbi:MAG: phage capsid protein [Candidatus Riflebacteria bacterium]|nr:phage capsid protein [Candidatus Riflebacteria bacterium]